MLVIRRIKSSRDCSHRRLQQYLYCTIIYFQPQSYHPLKICPCLITSQSGIKKFEINLEELIKVISYKIIYKIIKLIHLITHHQYKPSKSIAMQCNCRSKQLYRNYDQLKFRMDGKQISQARHITKTNLNESSMQMLKTIYENSTIYAPHHVQRIDAEEIYASPLWFYKNFIAMNKPCVITNAIQQQIIDQWQNPHSFKQLTQDIGPISVSLTPDGFADSIKNQYFVEPLQIKATIKDVIEWKQQKQNKIIKQNWIPYIQHQNNNLTEQCSGLIGCIDSSFKEFVGQRYFDGNQPDACNFWMGYRDSVSSLHKDPYENFYTTITGEKHFTLLPPTSIAYLHQDVYQSARYKIDEFNTLSAYTDPNSAYSTTRWISTNPDLQQDKQIFPELSLLQQNKYHLVLQAGQTLYLPSLWYHQVSQTHDKCCYTTAVNYWFDMSFGPGYALYQAARKLKGYP